MKESELFLNQIQLVARCGGWKANPLTNTLFCTEGVYNILEAPADFAPTLEEGLRFFIPEYIPIVKEMLTTTLERGIPNAVEAEVITTSGERLWVEVRSFKSVDESGGAQVSGTFQDITHRKRAEENRARLIAAVEQAVDAIVITDREGTILFVSPAFEKITGYTREEAVGKNPRILKSGAQDARFYEEMWRTLTSGDTWKGRFVNKKKDGSLFMEDAAISSVKDASGNILNYIAVKRDVTDHVLLEKQLFQAQKMESVGNLAAGIAHDFNNSLQVILGITDLLIKGKPKRSPEIAHLETIRQTAKDAGELVKEILTFGGRVKSDMRPVDLNECVQRMQKILKRTIPKTVEVRISLADDLHLVHGYPIQLQEALMNLAVNAYQAMPTGGRLNIETANVSVAGGVRCRAENVKPGEYVVLRVSDTGQGMERHVIEHIFEPFYTTKTEVGGTGLGLSVVYGIAKSHGGYIQASSEPGRGSTFTLYLPAVSGKKEFDASPALEKEPVFGTETILFVDDEEPIRSRFEETLTRSGYTVFTAENGRKALEIYRKNMEEIDLVILDCMMPEMGGDECLDEILKIDPGAKVLMVSGFPTKNLEMTVRGGRARGFIRKPCEVGDLLRSVRKVLGKTGASGSGCTDERDVPVNIFADEQVQFPESASFSAASTQQETPGTEEFPLRLRILVIDDGPPHLKILAAGLAQFGQTPLTATSGTEGLRMFQETPVDLVICDQEMPELDGRRVGGRIKDFCREKVVPKPPFILLTGHSEMGSMCQDEAERMRECGVDAILVKPVDVPDILKVAGRLMREAGRSL